MTRIRIVTDSTAGLTSTQQEELGITTIPLVVRFGTDEYREGIDISNAGFYERLTTDSNFPSTSQPSAGEFLAIYEELVKEADSIISIHVSSELSGTCESAHTALRGTSIDATVDVIDSRSVGSGLGHLAVVAGEMAHQGAKRNEIIDAVQQLIPNIRIGFAVKTLEYLRRGGRIGGAQAFLGSVLQLKPVLHVENGRVEPLDRTRSFGKAVHRLIRYIDDESGGDLAHCGIMHVRNEESAEQLKSIVNQNFNVGRWYGGELSPVVGSHVGPGMVAVSFPATGKHAPQP